MRLYAPIAKIDREQRMVFGYASTETTDEQGEIVRKTAIEAALPDYLRFGNIREMHQPSAVGITTAADMDDKGLHIAARVVDDNAWKKVTEGVYKGFSIGGQVTDRHRLDRNVITGCRITEISLVDRPANPEAVFEMWKLDRPETIAYADAEARKYPLDTIEHIRAAWAFINRPDIADRYPPAQSAMIRARIIAAWRREIDPSGPPALQHDTQAKLALSGGDGALRKSAATRRHWQAIHDHAVALGGHDYAAETASGDLDDDNATKGAGRAQARAVHDQAVKAGADCDLAKGGATNVDGERIAKLIDGNHRLLKAVSEIAGELATTIDELATAKARIARLEALPQPAKGALKVIAKGEDIGTASADTNTANDALALIKAAHGKPRFLSRG